MIDLDAYLGHIGWPRPRAPTLDVLCALCQRHTSTIPFENLDVLLGQPIRLDLLSLFDKLVTRRRGGYCFEQNTLFQEVLGQLGFRVTPLIARVRLGVAPDVPTPRTHMLLRVDLEGHAYVADVGFGFTPTAPLRLEAGLEQVQDLSTYRFRREATTWTLEVEQADGFTPAYVFTEEPCAPIDYEVANHFTSTHPRSHFTLGPLVFRHDPAGGVRYVLRGREWTARRRGEVPVVHAIESPEEALSVLAEHFHLELPAGTRLRGLE